uniref:ATP synthase subunit b, chloroplastic n=1 Tax=Bryopsis hypnoides TaxID=222885 RepID=D0EVQ8_BRYHP|nr:CF0 ATP synthase subunit I [Bryopsis hypnoides]ACX33748.1 CF0 ATP synthase subunit I [Bryopsis hypnoides]
MSFSLLTIVNILPLGEGTFGFNDNILETNVINLAVVVGIVVFFVGKNSSTFLENRQQTILNNLREADQRAVEFLEKLNFAKSQLEYAEKKAQEIREEGELKATQEKNNCNTQHEEDLARLEEYKQETLQFYQQKAFTQYYVSIVSRALQRVKEKFNKPFDVVFHVTVNNFTIARFTEYNPSNNFKERSIL